MRCRNWRTFWKRDIILIMLAVYGFICWFDFSLTMSAPQFEGSFVADWWIHASGIPLNLLSQFVVVAIPLMMRKTWIVINDRFGVFCFFYFYMIVMIGAHLGGVVSWVC